MQQCNVGTLFYYCNEIMFWVIPDNVKHAGIGGFSEQEFHVKAN